MNMGLIPKIHKELIQLNIKKNKQPNHKMGRPKQTFLQTDIDGQKKKKRKKLTLLIIRKTNQNFSEVPPCTSKNGHHQKVYKQ